MSAPTIDGLNLAEQKGFQVAKFMNELSKRAHSLNDLQSEDTYKSIRGYVIEAQRQIYAAKYMPYLPTEEELKRALKLEEFEKLEDI